MIIEQPARFLRWIYPHAIWRMDPSSKVIYLTFDDGPIPEATPFVLDTLARYGIKATFFMVGDNVRKHPDVFRQVVEAGHRIGNHTFNHIGGLRWLSINYLRNAQKANALMAQELSVINETLTTGNAEQPKPSVPASEVSASAHPHRLIHPQALTLFRPPHGWMRPLQYLVIRQQGYDIVMWDLVTRDYSKRLTADEVYENVKRYARNGSIITFHDSLRSIEKLKKILAPSLEWLINQGYEFRVFD